MRRRVMVAVLIVLVTTIAPSCLMATSRQYGSCFRRLVPSTLTANSVCSSPSALCRTNVTVCPSGETSRLPSPSSGKGSSTDAAGGVGAVGSHEEDARVAARTAGTLVHEVVAVGVNAGYG
jgi:hypothetical protein